MIISSLCDYYKIMNARGEVVPDEYSRKAVTHLIMLSADGELKNIIPLAPDAGKKSGHEILLPKRSEKTAVFANVVEHRPLYIFGLEQDGEALKVSAKAEKSHKAFTLLTQEFFEDIDSPIAKAYLAFAEKWQPEEQAENPYLLGLGKAYGTASFAFALEGRPDIYLNDEQEVREKWEKYYSEQSGGEEVLAQCSVTGKILPVARLHGKIKGVVGGQPSGCTLVCFNNESENSYGKTQSYNSGISEKAAAQYVTALNYLLAERKHHSLLSDMTLVYFALDKDEDVYNDEVEEILNGGSSYDEEESDAEVAEGALHSIGKQLVRGEKSEFDLGRGANVEYCIFALKPNSSRIMVKFAYRNTFGKLRENLLRFHNEFAIEKAEEAPAVRKLVLYLMPRRKGGAVTGGGKKSSSDKLASDIAQSLLASVVTGAPIGRGLQATMVGKVRTDGFINGIRAGFLKLCINRNNKNKEEIKMSLDRENKDAAYLCGRLFAVLEKAQRDSAESKLNRTVKDAYFSAASATPSVIFPLLIKLYQSHRKKLNDGTAIFYEKLIGEITGSLPVFPKTLSLDGQSKFILGYYHQNNELYKSKEEKENASNQ